MTVTITKTVEELSIELAEKCGSFDLSFDADENRNIPDSMPWTLTFTARGEERHFGGMLALPVEQLFQWAIDFVDGKVGANGQPITSAEALILVEGGPGDDLPFVIMRGNPASGTPVAAFRDSDDATAFLRTGA